MIWCRNRIVTASLQSKGGKWWSNRWLRFDFQNRENRREERGMKNRQPFNLWSYFHHSHSSHQNWKGKIRTQTNLFPSSICYFSPSSIHCAQRFLSIDHTSTVNDSTCLNHWKHSLTIQPSSFIDEIDSSITETEILLCSCHASSSLHLFGFPTTI